MNTSSEPGRQAFLAALVQARAHPATVAGTLRASRRALLQWAGVFAIAALLAAASAGAALAWGVLAAGAGLLTGLVLQARQAARTWPWLSDVVDWANVERQRAAAFDAPPAPGAPPVSSSDLQWMVGRTIASVRDAGMDTWRFAFGPDAGLCVSCPWRVVREGAIAVSSADHRQAHGLPAPVDAAEVATRLLATHAVTGAVLVPGTADVIVSLGEDLRLEILPVSSGYEAWDMTTPSGARVIAQGGGRCVRGDLQA